MPKRAALFGQQPQEPELHAVFAVRCNKRPFALPPDQQMFGCQLIDGFTHRTLADLVPRRELDLARNHFTWLPFPALQSLCNQRLDLLI